MNKDSSFFVKEGVSICKKSLTPKQVVLSLCRVKNWYLSDLAREIGVQRQSLNHYLNGRWTIPTRIKVLIAEKLGVDSSIIWDLETKE